MLNYRRKNGQDLTDLLYEYDTKRNKSESIARANAIKMYEEYPKLCLLYTSI